MVGARDGQTRILACLNVEIRALIELIKMSPQLRRRCSLKHCFTARTLPQSAEILRSSVESKTSISEVLDGLAGITNEPAACHGMFESKKRSIFKHNRAANAHGIDGGIRKKRPETEQADIDPEHSSKTYDFSS